MTNSTMTITEKRELIVSNPKNAYYELINRSNFSFYSDAFFIAEQAIIEITEGYSTHNSYIAQKHVLLRMLDINLV